MGVWMNAWGIIVAAGRGERLLSASGGVSKQFLAWRGAPLYWASALLLARCARLKGLVFVFPEALLAEERARAAALSAKASLGLPCRFAAGGKRRQDSVCNGLAALPDEATHVLIHDAARPFASPALCNRVLDELEKGAAGVIPGIPVTDTIKVVRDGEVAHTPDRETLKAVQTPQGFLLVTLRASHARALNEGWDVTDDAMLLERCGVPVRLVEGEPGNAKITRAEDLAMLEEKSAPSVVRVGYGYDVHAYTDPEEARARPLRLGGVAVPEGGFAVRAHSDGDVLLHALMDALLGCVGGGDIGQLFPDADPALDNVSSCVLLDEVMTLAREKGFSLEHVDVTVIAQRPKVGPHREEIRKNLARLLGLGVESVNVKATTEEGLGFTGSCQGIKSVAVATGRQTRG